MQSSVWLKKQEESVVLLFKKESLFFNAKRQTEEGDLTIAGIGIFNPFGGYTFFSFSFCLSNSARSSLSLGQLTGYGYRVFLSLDQ